VTRGKCCLGIDPIGVFGVAARPESYFIIRSIKMKKIMFVILIVLISSFAFSKTILLRSWRMQVSSSVYTVEQRIYCIDGYKWLITIPEAQSGAHATSRQMFERLYDKSVPITCNDKE
jgi:hypothetical protein